ncbi:anti-repressor Ant [Tenacibaculum phage Gundel_1]|uniref:Antirepressor protein n=1 Tax=Tenacibaculum phage Gundel_1 TaxID=2745672 RepID=A0A8E4ZGI0_9CAUD|nr:anti-repressor Ant [Tenacibaculum phage Gundel_1]QQV91499.1 antirepressor protein [Tenacibaculum phage Gundel_1]
MKQLINITDSEKGKAVNARELHTFLESKQDFTTWLKARIYKYDFIEGEDYTFHKVMEGNTKKHEYALSIDCAKEIAMVEGNEKGKQARRYFINCEKQLNKHKLPTTFVEALKLAVKQAEELEHKTLKLNKAEETIKVNEPKVVFANTVMGSTNSILIRQFAKDLCDGKFKIGQNKLFEWFRDNKYINKSNEPYQNYVDQGLFEVITRSIGSGEETFTSKTTKITSKGTVYFTHKIKLNYNAS